ncbi:hypothetical protein BDK51DRAFT_17692 [Blyttiomyces helicus]|uniref:L-lactate dehydrogenase n=1 Tax=Blyttiomyces helicus TaxID=388810 RepID=A0A4P9W528_9FUNG|nr:hypothetical protein BDK51DRAFT_17692 [Blyttiomyces helicus]|eukprot:RKO87042.1 hypothetical protein BDK51DRAFT_17692 [Blyttiomyces helicus]
MIANKPSRVAIIGAGSVGSTAAYACTLQGCASEVLLVDIDEKMRDAQVLDLQDCGFVSDTKVRAGSFADAGAADIIVITAGAKQRPGESRPELVGRNRAILASVLKNMQPIQPDAVLLIVANPVDALTSVAQQLSGLPKNQVLGSGTFLDSERLRAALADRLGVAQTAVHAYVIGEHGDSQVVAWGSATVGNTPLLQLPGMAGVNLPELAVSVRDKAQSIIAAKGATHFGIGTCVASLCAAILNDKRHVRPVSHYIPDLDVCIR